MIRAIKNLTRFLDHPPDTATSEELRNFQLYLVNNGTSSMTLNATITALRFFYTVTLNHSDIVTKISSVPIPRKLPVILNQKEVARLIEAAASWPKYQAALSIAYGAGLRISEIVALKVGISIVYE